MLSHAQNWVRFANVVYCIQASTIHPKMAAVFVEAILPNSSQWSSTIKLATNNESMLLWPKRILAEWIDRSAHTVHCWWSHLMIPRTRTRTLDNRPFAWTPSRQTRETVLFTPSAVILPYAIISNCHGALCRKKAYNLLLSCPLMTRNKKTPS